MNTYYTPISTSHYVYNPSDAWHSFTDMSILADHEEEFGNIELAIAIRKIIFARRMPLFNTTISKNPHQLVKAYIWKSYPGTFIYEEEYLYADIINLMIEGIQLANYTNPYRAYHTKAEAYLALCYVLMSKEVWL